MSEEDKDLLRKHRVELVKHVNLEDGLVLAHLRSRGVMTEQEEEKIKGENSNADQVAHLLNLLGKCCCNTMDKFIYSLYATGQSNVAISWLRTPSQPDSMDLLDDIEGEGSTNTLSKEDRDMLEKNRPQIMKDLDRIEGVLALLRAQTVITPETESHVKGLQERKGRFWAVGKLVDHLLRQPPESLEEFLHALINSGYSDLVRNYLREPTTPDTQCGNVMIGGVLTGMDQHLGQQTCTGLSTAELQNALKNNMRVKLDEWKTALEEGVSNREKLLPYINQPCSVKYKASKQQKGKGSTQQSLPNTLNLVESSKPGDRLVIYGDAGMGKTTLLKQLARSWIRGSPNAKLTKKFAYVFLIPLRYVGQGSLLHIICDELKLLPLSCLENLKKSLEVSEHQVLFLLDSFEELREDVKAKLTDIHDLITGKLFPKSTVVITSRPGSELKQSEYPTTAQLKDLPKNKVKIIIGQHFGENKDAISKVQKSFPAMAYLQKPINLALFIFIITQNKHLTLAYTQAELFSLVLQYIMLAFAKKKKLKEFTPQPGSYITNKDIPKDIQRLFSVIAKKCYEERGENNVVLHIEDTDDRQEYLDFGLFTAGPDTNTVLLPHRLFIEYFAAAHLAENPDAWTALFKEIREKKSESESPRPLSVVVRPMGLENVLRFVVALSPQPQLGQVCRQVASLFMLERQKIDRNYRIINFEKYYIELIRDCGFENGERPLVTALLNQPVRDMSRQLTKCKSHDLLQYLNYKQCATLTKKIHDLDLCVKDGKSTLSSCTGDNKRLVIADKFVVALVYWHDCIITADELFIRGEPHGRQLDLPASVFTRMSGVRQLKLYRCTLCKGLPDYMSDINISAASLHSSPCQTNSSLERVELDEVKGLEHCDVITSRQCQLVMGQCDDVRVSSLKTCFPRVSELDLASPVVYDYETEEELTSWLSTIPTVRGLALAPQHEGESVSLCHLLNILPERELKDLWLERSTLLLDVSDTSATVKQNNTLSRLVLKYCKGDVDLGQLLEVCSRQCPQLKGVWVVNSNLVFDDEKVESVKQLPGLQEFRLWKSAIHTPAGRRLSEQEAKQLLHRLCPSAKLGVSYYPKPESDSKSEPDSGSKPESESGSKPDSESGTEDWLEDWASLYLTDLVDDDSSFTSPLP